MKENMVMGMSTWNEPGYASGSILACLALLLPFSGTALAQDDASGPPRIELNRIEASGESWKSLKLDLFAVETASRVDAVSFAK
jgi:hypothetical protein